MSRGAELARWLAKVTKVAEEEVMHLRPMQRALSMVSRTIPVKVGNEMRAAVLRLQGIEVGEGTLVYGTPELSSAEATHAPMAIGRECIIDIGCLFELGESIVIGDHVTIGNNVMMITTTHELGPKEHRAGAATRSPVRVEDGAWIGPRSVILPGVTIGAGAIVDAGTVVNKNVAPSTRVSGTPARLVEQLDP